MKPFNLQAALAGAKVVTRCGKEVTQITVFENLKVDTYPVYAVVDGDVKSFTSEGKEFVRTVVDGDYKLYMAPITVERWTVLNQYCSAVRLRTKEDAEQYIIDNSLEPDWTPVKFTWEE